MKIEVVVPPTFLSERRYIITLLMGEFLGLEFTLVTTGSPGVVIVKLGESGEISMPDLFFGMPEDTWLDSASLPTLPLRSWRVPQAMLRPVLAEPDVPVVFGYDAGQRSMLVENGTRLDLGLDVFGSAFYLVSRYEEAVKPECDDAGRFPFSAALAHQGSLLERPLVNEYLEILWSCMEKLQPGLARRTFEFTVQPTHDVDRPFQFLGRPGAAVLRACLGMALRERRPVAAVRSLAAWARASVRGPQYDPFNTFDWMMMTCERAGVPAIYYFMSGDGGHPLDGDYTLDEPRVSALLRQVAQRGHEIGLHASYRSYRSADVLARELATLRRRCAALETNQAVTRSRQHYLRWCTPDTARALERAGIAHDSSLGFAERAGFRSGLCYEHPLYDVVERRELNVRESPLIVMDQTLLSERYMNLDPEQASDVIRDLKKRCRLFGGEFVALWHNSSLQQPHERALFRELFAN